MPNTLLINPVSGTVEFGVVPKIINRGILIPTGIIHFLSGKHTGPNRGFGATHIWAEHPKEMARKGFHLQNDVPAYVVSIIHAGTPLFFEENSWRQTRLMAVRAASGTAILELRERRDANIWSVVTAYAGTRTHGTRVGTVR